MECANGILGRKLTIKEHDNLMPSRVLKIALVDATCSMTVSYLTFKFSLITYPVKWLSERLSLTHLMVDNNWALKFRFHTCTCRP